MTNINPETGIRYGCVYLNSLDPDTAAWLWDDAENLSEAEAYAELKSEIERDADNIEDEVRIAVSERDYSMLANDRYMEDEVESAYNRLGYDDRDDYIDTRLERESGGIEIDEPILIGTCEGVRYEISWLGGAPLLWVLESPVISKAKLCSPCCPNAGDLTISTTTATNATGFRLTGTPRINPVPHGTNSQEKHHVQNQLTWGLDSP